MTIKGLLGLAVGAALALLLAVFLVFGEQSEDPTGGSVAHLGGNNEPKSASERRVPRSSRRESSAQASETSVSAAERQAPSETETSTTPSGDDAKPVTQPNKPAVPPTPAPQPATVKAPDSVAASVSSSEGQSAREALAALEAENAAEDRTTELAASEWTQERLSKRMEIRGIALPETILTEVTGKVMARRANTGLAFARVMVHSFVPEKSVRNSPVVPFRTEFTTDENGNFRGRIPLGMTAPENYPSIVLTVFAGDTIPQTAQVSSRGAAEPTPIGVGELAFVGKPAIVGAPGVATALGIFWAGDHLTNVIRDDVASMEVSEQLILTGRADPGRWSAAFRAETLAAFPKVGPSATFFTAEGEARSIYHCRIEPGQPNFLASIDGRTGMVRAVTSRASLDSLPDEAKSLLEESPNDGRHYAANATFIETGAVTVSGHVMDPNGHGLEGAVVLARRGSRTVSVVSEPGGMFSLTGILDRNSTIEVSHELFVTTFAWLPTLLRQPAVVITMKDPRPDFTLMVRSADTGLPVTSLVMKLDWTEARNRRENNKWVPVTSNSTAQHSSPEGRYRVTGEHLLTGLTLQAVGFRPLVVNIQQVSAFAAQVSDVAMIPVRVMEVRPRDFTFAEQRGDAHWDIHEATGDIYTYWGMLSVEYTVNFDQGLPEGMSSPSPFDLVIGVRNQGIVDNSYRFRLEIFVDDQKVANPTIFADSVNPRTATVRLGNLSGTRRIKILWLNDRWIPNELDANIRITSLRFLEAVE